VSIGGRKFALRRLNPSGVAQAEVIRIGAPATNDGDDRPLLKPLVKQGQVIGNQSLSRAQDHHRAAFAELPLAARSLSRGEAVIDTVFE